MDPKSISASVASGTPSNEDDLAVVGPTTSTGTTRKKKWAARARTGCSTCRARRVKCDEEKPVCKRCTTAGRECNGFGYGDDPGRGGAAFAKDGDRDAKGQQRKLLPATPHWKGMNKEAEPPDWDYLQSISYYVSVMRPAAADKLKAPVPIPFNDPDFIHPGFICSIITSHISRVSKSQHRLLRFGEDRSLAGAWTSFYRNLQDHMDILHECIRDEGRFGGKMRVFYCIFRLFEFDMKLLQPTWLAHLKAYFAFVRHFGGPRATMSLSKAPVHTFSHMLLQAIILNATSPVSQQIRDFDTWSDRDIGLIIRDDIRGDFPCPLALILAMVHITRLRIRIGTGATGPGGVTSAMMKRRVRAIFKEIDLFEPEIWSSKLGSDDDEFALLNARLYQATIRLYAIMALPRVPALLYFGSDSYSNLKLKHREALMARIYEFNAATDVSKPLYWPLIVAGVAAADGGTKEEQTYIAASLYSIWQRPNEPAMALIVIQSLRELWASGKTNWEDFFNSLQRGYVLLW